ncbi:hypothetical protein ACFL21_00770 [Patescibacteria group bacterium]
MGDPFEKPSSNIDDKETRINELLEDPWKVDKIKDKKYTTNFQYIITNSINFFNSNNFDLETSDKLKQALCCMAHLDLDWYDEFLPNFEYFIKKDIINGLKSDCEENKNVDLNIFDLRFRQMYKFSKYIDELEAFFLDSIKKINEIMIKAMDDGKVDVDSFLQSKIDAVSLTYHQTEEYPERATAVFGDLVNEGKIFKRNEMEYYMVVDDEEWDLKLTSFEEDADLTFIGVSKHRQPEISGTISSSKFLRMFEAVDETLKEKFLNGLVGNHLSEYSKTSQLEAYDLPNDQNIRRISVAPKTYDPTIAAGLQTMYLTDYILNKKYSNLSSSEPIYSDDPKKEILAEIEEQYKNGIKFFSLDIYSHGQEEGISLGKFDFSKNAKDLLDAEDFVEIVNKYPDAHFQINTMACFGGGLRKGVRKAIREEKIKKEQISLFLQTKPEIPNSTNREKDGEGQDSYYGTYFHLQFMKSLLEGNGYGKAAADANKKTKEVYYLDPEFVIEGELIAEVDDESLTAG